MIMNLINNPSFMKMMTIILYWFTLYVFVSILNGKFGVGRNLLKTSILRISKLRRSCLDLQDLFRDLEDAQSFDKDNALDCLKDILQGHKRVSRLLASYLFDDKDDRDVNEAKKLVDSIPGRCRAIISDAIDGRIENSDEFERIDADLKTAIERLEQASTIDSRNALLKND